MAPLDRRRWLVAGIGCALAGLAVGGCAMSSGGGIATGAAAPPQSEAAGSAPRVAPVKIAMLLPLSGTGATAAVAKGMKQAGELAVFEFDNPALQLVVKDDKGTPEGAAAAADEALREGAELILGPLFSTSVKAVAPAARRANVPVIAFSNDRQAAGEGVYVLGLSVEQDVDRIVQFAIEQGRGRIAAFIPSDAFGRIVETSFRGAVARHGGTLVALETYAGAGNGMLEPSKRLVEAIRSADDAGNPVQALFVPGGAETLTSLGPLLTYAELDTQKVKLLGTGGWDTGGAGREAALSGAWYPAPDPRGWRAFAERFGQTYGSQPPRMASLAYDAVGLAIKLASEPRERRFVAANLTRAEGFGGVDGLFRLTPAGTAERALAVLEVQKFATPVVGPPASGFVRVERTTGIFGFN